MDCTDGANSVTGTIASVMLDERISYQEPPPTSSRTTAETSDVILASRECVKTLVAQRIGQLSEERQGELKHTRRRSYFLVKQLYSQEQVAVDLHLFEPDDFLEREWLQQYADQMMDLDYLALPRCLDAFELETPLGCGFAVVQTAIAARSIQAWMADGYCFDESELKLIALRVLSALQYLHGETENSVGCTLHRAIKPSNILLENRRVADPLAEYDPQRDRRKKGADNRGFGRLLLVNLGKGAVEDSSGTLTSEGTYGYTAPEQFYGRSQPASDLYSLGATLIYMASGKSPANWMGPDLKISPSNMALSRSFIEWISRLTHADLSQRTASASSALQELELLQIVGKPISQSSYTLAAPRRQLSLEPKMSYLDFKVSSTPQELRVCFNYDRVSGDRSHRHSAPIRMMSPEELKTALLLAIAVTIIGGTVALTGSPFLGFVVALLLPCFYFLFVPLAPVVELNEASKRQARVRLRRDAYGRMFVTLSTTPIPRQSSRRRAIAQSAFLESKIHFSNVPIRLLCTKSGLFTPKISFIVATDNPKRNKKVSITGSQEEIRWLRVHIGRWLKS